MSDPGSGRWLGDVPLSLVWAKAENNPRTSRTEASRRALRNSIRGWSKVIEPIVCVREAGPDGAKYRAIAGYSRLQAANDERLSTIPVVVDDWAANLRQGDAFAPDLPEETAHRLLATTENLVRADLSDWDTAATLHQLSQEGMTGLQIAMLLSEESGQAPMGMTTLRTYVAIGGFPESLTKRLRPLGAAGYRIAKQLVPMTHLRQGKHWLQPETDRTIDRLLAASNEDRRAAREVKIEGQAREHYRIKAARLRLLLDGFSPANAEERACVETLLFLAGDDPPQNPALADLLRRLGVR
jgi:hypothetical protein